MTPRRTSERWTCGRAGQLKVSAERGSRVRGRDGGMSWSRSLPSATSIQGASPAGGAGPRWTLRARPVGKGLGGQCGSRGRRGRGRAGRTGRAFPAPVPGGPGAQRGGRGRTMAGSGARRFVRGLRAAQTAASSGRHGDGPRRLRAPRGLQARPGNALLGLRSLLGQGSLARQGRPGRARTAVRAAGARVGRAVAELPAGAVQRGEGGLGPGALRCVSPPRHRGGQATEAVCPPRSFVSGAASGHTCGSQALPVATPPPFLPLPPPATPLLPLPRASPGVRAKPHGCPSPGEVTRSCSPTDSLCICKVLVHSPTSELQCDLAGQNGGLSLPGVESWELWSLDPAAPPLPLSEGGPPSLREGEGAAPLKCWGDSCPWRELCFGD